MRHTFTIFVIFVALSASTLCFAGRNFNGTSDTIAIAAIGNALDVSTGPFALSAWALSTNVTSEHDVFSKWNGLNTNQEQYLLTVNSGIGSGFGGCIGNFFNLSGGNCGVCGTPAINTWYNISETTDASTFWKLQVGGGASCTSSGGGAYVERRNAGGVNARVSGQNTGGGSGNWAGTIAEVGLWQAALSTGEQSSLTMGVSPTRVRLSKLIGYFPLWGAASPEPDLSGNHNNGTLTGTTAGKHCPCGAPAWVP